MTTREAVESLLHTGKELNRVLHHLTSPLHDLAECGAGDITLGCLNGSLDHREGETFHAVAEMGQVLPLTLQESFRRLRRITPRREQRIETLLGQHEEGLGEPERVISVERDNVDLTGVHSVSVPTSADAVAQPFPDAEFPSSAASTEASDRCHPRFGWSCAGACDGFGQ